MPRCCCVPGCKSNYASTKSCVSTFSFPNEEDRRKEWISAIHREDSYNVTKSSVVCIKHFAECDVIKEDVMKRDDGTMLVVPRKIPKLTKDAVPTILPHQPKMFIKRKPPDESHKELAARDEAQFKEFDCGDGVSDFTNLVNDVKEELCRVCLSKENLTIDIYDLIEENITVAAALMFCAYPLKITEDSWPQYMCESCFETFQIAYRFRDKCLASDKIIQIKHHKRKRKSLDTELNNKKSKPREVLLSEIKPETDFEVVYEGCETEELRKENISKNGSRSNCNINEVEKNMEILHGGTSEADGFLHQMVLPATRRKTNIKASSKRSSSISSNNKLLQSFKINHITRYKPVVGKFKGSVKLGLHGNLFLEASGYLFEFGLLKGSTRHLRCSVPNCIANGKQTLLPNGEYDDEVEILIPHNHEPLSENTMKKHMFLSWMRKKLRSDKTLHIRDIYEDACFLDPDIKHIIPLSNIVDEICCHQLTHKINNVTSFEMFYNLIEADAFEDLHFTLGNQQFYQEKFYVEEDESMAVLFANTAVIKKLSNSQIMHVDASFKIDTNEDFKYQLVTVLVRNDDSYLPILFALVNKKSQLIFQKIFLYLYHELAPELRPKEIITDYEANVYYALAEIYTNSSIGGSIFYYIQNLYKKLCSLNLSLELETNVIFCTVYHMLLMLPLLPVDTILDSLNDIELKAKTSNIIQLARPLLDYVRTEWILNVTPKLFCVYKSKNRINENVITPFKKLRDYLLFTKPNGHKIPITVTYIVEKVIELEHFLARERSKTDKKSFGCDLRSKQKENVLLTWRYIEEHPKIEIHYFLGKFLDYIKCMENQLWIWGFYRCDGDTDDTLINASHFAIEVQEDEGQEEDEIELE